MLKYLLLIATILSGVDSFSQHIMKGRIISKMDLKPLSYANIGIIDSPVGTLSNEDGSFSIRIPDKNLQDTLVFSSLGYSRQLIPVSWLINKSENTIALEENATVLEQVVVLAKKEKGNTYVLGNRYTRGGFLYADSISAGAAMALLIDNKYPSYHSKLSFPFGLEEVKLYVDKNSRGTFKIRIRFLQRDSLSGQPGRDLLAEDIIITSSARRGWIDADLRPYHFVATEPFYLMAEWIMEDKDRLALLNEYAAYQKANPNKVTSDSTVVDGKKIGFFSYYDFSPGTHFGISPLPFSLQHYICYYRTNSFGAWQRAPVILTAKVSVVPVQEN
jgi:hypothetical protein